MLENVICVNFFNKLPVLYMIGIFIQYCKFL